MAPSFDDPSPPSWEPEPLHLPVELPPPLPARDVVDEEPDEANPPGVIVIDLC